MRLLIFLGTSGLVHFAAAWCLLLIRGGGGVKRRRLVLGVAGGLSFLLPLMRYIARHSSSDLTELFLGVALIELAIVAVAVVPALVFVAVSRSALRALEEVKPAATAEEAATRLSRRQTIEAAAGASLAVASGASIGWGALRGRHAFALEEVTIAIRGWPRVLDGYVIAQVSDVHVGPFVHQRELDEGFELVRRIRPDLVVATGDLVDFVPDLVDPLLAQLSAIPARDGACAILGNHDHYAGASRVAAKIRASKVRLLDNSGLHLRPSDGGGFALLGVDDLFGRKEPDGTFRGPDLARALASVAPDLPRILLAHDPKFFLEAQGRVGLQLSGHTHGGQINPGLRPATAVMPFVAGRYERAGSSLWVNRGFGVSGPPSRVLAAPEVTKIVIVSA